MLPPTAGMMDQLSGAQKMELVVWGSTLGLFMFTLSKGRGRFHRAFYDRRAKPGSTGPPIQFALSMAAQNLGIVLPLLLYWVAAPYNKFHQPEWLADHPLPPPPDVFGVDGVVIGRMAGLLGLLTGMMVVVKTLRAMGDQYIVFGVVSTPHLLTLPEYCLCSSPCYRPGRNPESLPMALSHTFDTRCTRAFPARFISRSVVSTDLLHSGTLFMEISFPLALWSSVPLYLLPLGILGHVIRGPMEVCRRCSFPHLGRELTNETPGECPSEGPGAR